MFKKSNQEPTDLDKAIASLYEDLNGMTGDEDNYAKTVDQLVKLEKIRSGDDSRKISPDALLAAGANILGIVIIVGYEHKNVITSKAMSFIKQLR